MQGVKKGRRTHAMKSVYLVDAHAKGHGAHHDGRAHVALLAAEEPVLHLLAGLGFHARVVRTRVEVPPVDQIRRQLFG